MPLADRRFLAAFAAELAEAELTDADTSGTPDWVVARVYGSGQVTRLGLAATGLLLAALLRVRERAPFFALAPGRRAAVAAELAATRLPLAAEYVRAVRALAITHAYQRHGHQR